MVDDLNCQPYFHMNMCEDKLNIAEQDDNIALGHTGCSINVVINLLVFYLLPDLQSGHTVASFRCTDLFSS